MSSLAPANKVLEPTNPINNNKSEETTSPMPNTNANRHFIDPKSYQGIDAEEQFKTRTLSTRYKLPQIWSESASGLLSIPYKFNFKTTAHPFMTKFTTWIRVQNLPLFISGERVSGERVKNSDAHLCAMVATAISALIADSMIKTDKKTMHSYSYFSKVIDVKVSSVEKHFIEFAVTHIGDSCLPLTYPSDASTPEETRVYYPILMDRSGLHHATTDAARDAMFNYTEAFSRQGKPGRRMMLQAERHYLTDGLPSKCLNIQVVGWEQVGST